MPDDTSTSLNPPKQARSRRTLERIVRASLQILETEGPDGLTVQAIVARAESSVGSFYARFAGKDDLLDYLGERVWSEARERWDAALAAKDWDGLTLPQLVDGAARLLAQAGRTRAAYRRALGTSGHGEESFEAFRAHVMEGLGELFMAREKGISHADPSTAVAVGLRAVVGVLEAAELPGWRPPDEDRLVGECARLLRAYLVRTDAGEPEPPGEVDFFDIWG